MRSAVFLYIKPADGQGMCGSFLGAAFAGRLYPAGQRGGIQAIFQKHNFLDIDTPANLK
jgi:hypothetical protein